MNAIPLAEARASLSRLVDEAVSTHERIEITRNGRRAAVLMSADDFDAVMETLDILDDVDLVAQIREGLADIEAGRVSDLDEVAADLAARSAQ